MSAPAPEAGPRTYGQWYRAQGFGIGRLGTAQTVVVFIAASAPIVVAYLSGTAALVTGGVSVVVVMATLVRIDGQSLTDVVVRRARFHRARAAGWTRLTGGILTDHARGQDLPGPMAPLVPLQVEDGRGGHQALLWDRTTGWLTAVLRVSPVGLDLADTGHADAWVAGWAVFLAECGYLPIRHLSVTIDTAPSGGATLRDYVEARLDPSAPAAARDVLAELVAATPAVSAHIDTRVAITFDPQRANPVPPDLRAAAAEVVRWLPGLETRLAGAGVAVAGRAGLEWLIGRLRLAYDPASRSEVVRLGTGEHHPDLLRWSEAGPVAAEEQWESWRHDTGLSVSWAMVEAPRHAVVSHVLAPLLQPGPYPRRVTLLYQPTPAAQTAQLLEREITSTHMRRALAARARRDETARDRDAVVRAVASAREEAQGAGVGEFCLYVSTTVDSAADRFLPAAAADVVQRAGSARLRLRRLNGAQAAGFAAALGLGLDPAELAHRSHR